MLVKKTEVLAQGIKISNYVDWKNGNRGLCNRIQKGKINCVDRKDGNSDLYNRSQGIEISNYVGWKDGNPGLCN